MSGALYFEIGVAVAAYFGLHDPCEQGDWPKATALIVFSALWPFTIGLGVGMCAASLFRSARSLGRAALAKARGEDA